MSDDELKYEEQDCWQCRGTGEGRNGGGCSFCKAKGSQWVAVERAKEQALKDWPEDERARMEAAA